MSNPLAEQAPRSARVGWWLDHYADCDACGLVPDDVDVPERSGLCPRGLQLWRLMSDIDRIGVVKIVLEYQAALEDVRPGLVPVES